MGHTLARRGLLAPWQSVLVSSQRQGRGQLRRNWVSPAGNIYAALRLPMQEPFASSAASTVTGAMLAAALGKLGFEVRLKWPNDLAVLDGDTPAKVAGILLEERAGVLLAGIGIVMGSVFQALGNGVFSLTVSICRQLVVLIPAAWLLSRTGEVNMVWWAFIIAEVVSLALSLVFMARINRTVIVPLSEKQDAAV